MRDGWDETTLGDVAAVRTPSASAEATRFVGLEHLESGSPMVSRYGTTAEVSGTTTSFFCGDTLFAKLRPYLRKVAVAPFDGRCTGEALVYYPTSNRVLPGFLALVLQDERAIRHAVSTSSGTRMPRTSAVKMSSLQIALPPIDEQRRIVDLIRALDETIAAMGEEEAAALRLLALLRAGAVESTSVSLGDLALMRSGPSWKSSEESPVPADGAVPVLGIGNTPRGERLDLTERKYVKGVPESALRLSTTSLVMIRTNGNRSRIGNVYRATDEVDGFAVSAFQIAIQPHEAEMSSFLYWYLGSPEVQREISANASGSTGLGNVAIGWLKTLPIPVLDKKEQADYVDRCETMLAVLQGLEDRTSHLRSLRANLLTALLSGEHEIPSSYDEVAEGLAA